MKKEEGRVEEYWKILKQESSKQDNRFIHGGSDRGFSVSRGCHNKIVQIGWFKYRYSFPHSSGSWTSGIRTPAWSRSEEGPLLGSQRLPPLCVPCDLSLVCAWRVSNHLFLFLQGHQFYQMRASSL